MGSWTSRLSHDTVDTNQVTMCRDDFLTSSVVAQTLSIPYAGDSAEDCKADIDEETILDLCEYASEFTNYETALDVLHYILLPLLSKSDATVVGYNMLKYVEGKTEFYLEHQQEPSVTVEQDDELRDFMVQNRVLQFSDLKAFLWEAVSKGLQFAALSKCSLEQLELMKADERGKLLEKIFFPFVLGLATGDLEVLFWSFQQYIESNEKTGSEDVKVEHFSSFFETLGSEYELVDAENHEPVDWVRYDERGTEEVSVAVVKDNLFVVDKRKSIVKIALSQEIGDKLSRFAEIGLRSTKNNYVVGTGNLVLVGSDSLVIASDTFSVMGHFSYAPGCKETLSRPLTSDGSLIYCVTKTFTVKIFSVDNVFCLHYLGSLHLCKPTKTQRNIDWKIPVVTNGIVLELFFFERLHENSFYYEIQTYSLVDGRLVRRIQVVRPYRISSVAYDAYSQYIYFASDGIIIREKADTSFSPWMNGLDLASLSVMDCEKQTWGRKKVWMWMIRTFASLVIPFIGVKTKPQQARDVYWGFVTSGDPCVITDFMRFLDGNQPSLPGYECLQVLLLELLRLTAVRTKLDRNQLDRIIEAFTNKRFQGKMNEELFVFCLQCPTQLLEASSWFLSTMFENGCWMKHAYLLYSKRRGNWLSYLGREEKLKEYVIPVIRRIRKEHHCSYEELAVLCLFQDFLFESVKENSSLWMNSTLELSKAMLSEMTLLAQVPRFDARDNEPFIKLFRRFMLEVQTCIVYPDFVLGILRDVQAVVEAFCNLGISSATCSSTRLGDLFMHVCDLLVSCLATAFDGFGDLSQVTTFLPLAEQLASLSLESKNEGIYPDLSRLDIANCIYEKVRNPGNKRVAAEMKEFEGGLVLIFTAYSGLLGELRALLEDKTYPISASMNEIVRTVYRIRNDLVEVRQATASYEGPDSGRTLRQQYGKYFQMVKDKCSLLLSLRPVLLVSIQMLRQFITSELDGQQFMVTVQSIPTRILVVLDAIKKMVLTRGIPEACYLYLVQKLISRTRFYDFAPAIAGWLSRDEIADKFIGVMECTMRLLWCIPCAVVSLVVFFVSILIRMECQDLAVLPIERMMNQLMVVSATDSKPTKEVFRKCLVFLCCEIESLRTCNKIQFSNDFYRMSMESFSDVPVEYMDSFAVADALVRAGYKPAVSADSLITLMRVLPWPEIKGLSRYISHAVVHFPSRQATMILDFVMDAIGHLLIGADSKILRSARGVSGGCKYECGYVRTSQAKLNACLDLLEIFRSILLSKSKLSETLSQKFWSILQASDFSEAVSVRQTIVVLNVLSGIWQTVRPRTMVLDPISNKKYYVISIDLEKRECLVVTIPITDKYYPQRISLNNYLKAIGTVSIDIRRFRNVSEYFANIRQLSGRQIKSPADAILSFYATESLKLAMEDEDYATDLKRDFMQTRQSFDKFAFLDMKGVVEEILKKALMTENQEGLLQKNLNKPRFGHISFTEVTWEVDYELTEHSMFAKRGIHVFISSVLDSSEITSFLFDDYSGDLMIGVLNHSLYDNRLMVVDYRPSSGGFYLNGVLEREYSERVSEMSYQNSNTRWIGRGETVFSWKLSDNPSSFFVVLFPGSRIEYQLGKPPSNEDSFFFSLVNKAISLFRSEQSEEKRINLLDFRTPNIEMGDFGPQDKIREIPCAKTCVGQRTSIPIYWKDVSRPEILSSPIMGSECYEVYEMDGRFTQVPSDTLKMDPVFAIPPLHCTNLFYLPCHTLNRIMVNACSAHRRFVATKQLTAILADPTIAVSKTLELAKISKADIVLLASKLLVLCEPVNFNNLEEGKCPIDFNLSVLDGTCVSPRLYNEHRALLMLMNHMIRNCRDFASEWQSRIIAKLSSIQGTFISPYNTEFIVVQGNESKKPYRWHREDVSGWLIFPLQIGLRYLPRCQIANQVFPSKENRAATYAYCRGKTLELILEDDTVSWVVLPILVDTNLAFRNSFVETAILFKYFAIFIKQCTNLPTWVPQFAQVDFKQLLFKAISCGSPFFYTHDLAVLNFVEHYLPLNIDDIQAYGRNLRHFQAVAGTIPHVGIETFVKDRITDLTFHQYRTYHKIFPEFTHIENRPDLTSEVPLPELTIPATIRRSSERTIWRSILKLLEPRSSIEGFPYYLILTNWAEAFLKYPETETVFLSKDRMRIEFLGSDIPSEVWFAERELLTTNMLFDVSYDDSFTNCRTLRGKEKVPTNGKFLYLRFSGISDLDERRFVVCSTANRRDFDIRRYRDIFVKDMVDFVLHWSSEDDQKILMRVPLAAYSNDPFAPRLNPEDFPVVEGHSLRMLSLRSELLISFNYWVSFEGTSSWQTSMAVFRRFVSSMMSKDRFLRQVRYHSADMFVNLDIDRRQGMAARSGSQRPESSMIGQFAQNYSSKRFKSVEMPFHIQYKGEKGIDVGGLARDFASELTKDINSPQIGLFVRTPNGRNQSGNYRDCLVPWPDPKWKDVRKIYNAFGGLLAMGIRCELTQPYHFPHLFWKYLVTGTLTEQDIFDIDEEYKNLILGLQNALVAPDMTEESFESVYGRDYSVKNMKGEEIKLRNRRVVLSNCSRYITECNRFRVQELETHLSTIRNGFWENLGFNVPEYVTPEILQYLACGDNSLDLRAIRELTDTPNGWGFSQRVTDMFWSCVARMTNEQRRKLLQFWTGSMSLPAGGTRMTIELIDAPKDSRMPGASSCFYRLYLPPFSNVNNMFRMLIYAIENTATFENS